MFTIAFSTFKEIYRKRIFHFISIITIVYLVLLTVIFKFMGSNMTIDYGKLNMLSDVSSAISIIGFYFSSMLVAFLTVMLSIGIVSTEIENGTILTILTKPLRRFEYILGKYLGTAVLIIIYSIILYVAVIVISTLSSISIIDSFGIAALAKGFLFFVFEPLVILALALYGSTNFKTLNNGILVIAIYILGVIGGVIEQIGAYAGYEFLSTLGIIASLISPFEVVYRKMISTIFTSLGSFNFILGFGMSEKSTAPSIWMMVYVTVYLIGMLLLSVKNFRRKDI